MLSLIHTDAADEEDSVDLGGRRIIKKKKTKRNTCSQHIIKNIDMYRNIILTYNI